MGTYLDVSAMSAYLSSGVNNATISLNGTNKVGPCLLAAMQWMIVNVCGKSTVFPSTCQPKKKIILEKKLKKSLKKKIKELGYQPSVPWYINPSFGSLEKYPNLSSGTFGWNFQFADLESGKASLSPIFSVKWISSCHVMVVWPENTKNRNMIASWINWLAQAWVKDLGEKISKSINNSKTMWLHLYRAGVAAWRGSGCVKLADAATTLEKVISCARFKRKKPATSAIRIPPPT